jgi:hypothetical protein
MGFWGGSVGDGIIDAGKRCRQAQGPGHIARAGSPGLAGRASSRLRSMTSAGLRRGAIALPVIRNPSRPAAVIGGLFSCMVLAGATHAVPTMAVSAESVSVVHVVQLPPRLDRRVLLDLQYQLDAAGPRGAVVVEVLAPATLDDHVVGQLAGIASARAHGSLVVWLEDQGGGGPGGALLYGLAPGRLAEPAAAAAAHQQFIKTVAALETSCQGRCAQLVHSRPASAFQATYPTLTAFVAAQPVRPRVTPAGVLGNTPGALASTASSSSSGGFFLGGIALIVILALGAAVGWYLALRGKKRPPPASRRRRVNLPSESHVQPPERGRPTGGTPAARNARSVVATPAVTAHPSPHEGCVRTELHPQGYIELGGCLYRVTWAGPPERRPELGELVQVAQDRAHGLVAFPVANSAGPSAGSTKAGPSHPGS